MIFEVNDTSKLYEKFSCSDDARGKNTSHSLVCSKGIDGEMATSSPMFRMGADDL